MKEYRILHKDDKYYVQRKWMGMWWTADWSHYLKNAQTTFEEKTKVNPVTKPKVIKQAVAGKKNGKTLVSDTPEQQELKDSARLDAVESNKWFIKQGEKGWEINGWIFHAPTSLRLAIDGRVAKLKETGA